MFCELALNFTMALDLTNSNRSDPNRKPEPLPDDFAGAAHEWFVNFEVTKADLELNDLVHDLLIRVGLTQIGIGTNRQGEVTSTLYHIYPYFIVNRLSPASQMVSVRITYNRQDVRELQVWAEQLCSNAKQTEGLRCNLVTSTDT